MVFILGKQMKTFKGSSRSIGHEYGKACRNAIHKNLSILVWREGYEPLAREDGDFIAWRKRQESILGKKWPWLLEEMAGLAEAVEVSFEDILLLNLRAWQYNYYGAPGLACSSLVITLDDGTIACAGALDDPVEHYCGPVFFKPDTGYGCITLPITGTSWATRGLNEKGLTIGISSQILPGLKKSRNMINGDLAVRIIMQTCSAVGEVREFCRQHPFTMNLVCTDVKGGIFCAHNTAAGLFEIPCNGFGAITNHVVNNDIKRQLTAVGINEFPELNATHARQNSLIDFAQRHSGKCIAAEVMKFISARDESNPGSINRHNGQTAYLTFANPQNYPDVFWILQPHESEPFNHFNQFKVSDQVIPLPILLSKCQSCRKLERTT